ncbi:MULTISPECIES: hypothetical protein [unclassified Nocardiopsis]|uniref:hypothetical protein n=1 Tax=unclassified Nocardiopsis TaxID=2649073 RepID=UPI0018E51305|nr:hypothetical protein [Nocardiopsis sp. TNDT3]
MQRITAYLSSRLLSRRDDGYSTETVIITAVLVLAAGAAAVAIDGVIRENITAIGGG